LHEHRYYPNTIADERGSDFEPRIVHLPGPIMLPELGRPAPTDHDEHHGTRLEGTIYGLDEVHARLYRAYIPEDILLTKVVAERICQPPRISGCFLASVADEYPFVIHHPALNPLFVATFRIVGATMSRR
jgi:hypothetical protein